MRIRTALEDERLTARIAERRPLLYTAGPSEPEDRPAHVRAASGLVWLGRELALVQDDADFVAFIEPVTGVVRALPLRRGEPARGARVIRQFDDARGNKADKLDLEALFATDATLVGLGSGATPARRRALLVDRAEAQVVSADDLYRALEAMPELAGSELNLEGAAPVPDGRLRLFQRGNGDPARARPPIDATLDLPLAALVAYLRGQAPAPPLDAGSIVQYQLGALAGARATFTDAAHDPTSDRLYYLACAERSPDAVRDGEVVGSALGVFDELDGGGALRFARLVDDEGRPLAIKAEGLAFGSGAVHVVLDADDPARPSELCRLELDGPWHPGASQRW